MMIVDPTGSAKGWFQAHQAKESSPAILSLPKTLSTAAKGAYAGVKASCAKTRDSFHKRMEPFYSLQAGLATNVYIKGQLAGLTKWGTARFVASALLFFLVVLGAPLAAGITASITTENPIPAVVGTVVAGVRLRTYSKFLRNVENQETVLAHTRQLMMKSGYKGEELEQKMWDIHKGSLVSHIQSMTKDQNSFTKETKNLQLQELCKISCGLSNKSKEEILVEVFQEGAGLSEENIAQIFSKQNQEPA